MQRPMYVLRSSRAALGGVAILAFVLLFGLTAPDSASACTIATPAGPFTGADAVVTTTIDPATARVTAIVLQNCQGGVLGAPTALTFPATPPWPVGAGNGTNGSDVVETYIPRLSGGGTRVRLGFVYDDGAGGISALLTTNGLANGPPILVLVD